MIIEKPLRFFDGFLVGKGNNSLDPSRALVGLEIYKLGN
jgi:hypothetical protein